MTNFISVDDKKFVYRCGGVGLYRDRCQNEVIIWRDRPLPLTSLCKRCEIIYHRLEQIRMGKMLDFMKQSMEKMI